MSDSDTKRGLYSKYFVQRLPISMDNASRLALIDIVSTTVHDALKVIRPPEKHESCPYFVLDPIHDDFARTALNNYALHCCGIYPDLAKDIYRLLDSTWDAHRAAMLEDK